MEKNYLAELERILNQGTEHDDRTGTGTIRVFGSMIRYDLSNNKIPLLTTKKMAIRVFCEELIWMLSGSTDNSVLQSKKVHIWDGNSSKSECAKFGREENDLGPIYGHQWRNYGAKRKDLEQVRLETIQGGCKDYYSEQNKRYVNKAYLDNGFDQIKNLIEMIQNQPNSRRIIVNAFHPTDALITNPPPCHSFFQVQVSNNKLNLLLLQRSGDFFLGVPANIFSYSLLTHLLAKVCGLEAGEFVHQVVDAHIYKDHIDQCQEQISRIPFDTPKIKINDRLANKGFLGLLDFKYEDIEIIGYQSHPAIKGKMSV